jgi:3'-5' exoribonuclease
MKQMTGKDTNGDARKDGKGRFIKDLRNGDLVEGAFVVRRKESPKDYKSKPGKFFYMEVGDRSGEIGVKYWGRKEPERIMELYKGLRIGDIVQLSGVVQEDRFEDKLIISVDEEYHYIRPAMGEMKVEDFLPVSTSDLDELMARVITAVASVKEPHLRALLDSFFSDQEFVREYRRLPSAMVHHHNYLGGNLEHIVAVLEVCEALCRVYKDLDRDLLVTGALLHDMGKLHTYKYTAFIDVTDEGKLVGHAVLGEKMLVERIDSVKGFPKVLAIKLAHMVLKHMGNYEDVGVRGIHTVEAQALHMADNIDAQVKEVLQDVQRGRETEGGDWGYSKALKGPVYLK